MKKQDISWVCACPYLHYDNKWLIGWHASSDNNNNNNNNNNRSSMEAVKENMQHKWTLTQFCRLRAVKHNWL